MSRPVFRQMIKLGDGSDTQKLELSDPKIESCYVRKSAIHILSNQLDFFAPPAPHSLNVLNFFQKYGMERELKVIRLGLHPATGRRKPKSGRAFFAAVQLEDHHACGRVIAEGQRWDWGVKKTSNGEEIFGSGGEGGKTFSLPSWPLSQLELLPSHVLWALLRASDTGSSHSGKRDLKAVGAKVRAIDEASRYVTRVW